MLPPWWLAVLLIVVFGPLILALCVGFIAAGLALLSFAVEGVRQCWRWWE